MKFENLDLAELAIREYQSYIGYFIMPNSTNIVTDIVVGPEDQSLFSEFLKHYIPDRDNEIALLLSGYMSGPVCIYVLSIDTNGIEVLYKRLDTFLNGLDKF